jgi:hypothetical protein
MRAHKRAAREHAHLRAAKHGRRWRTQRAVTA